MDNISEIANRANTLRMEYTTAYESDFEEGKKKELEYLELRRKVLSMVDENINRQKSIPMKVIEEKVANKPQVKRISTGINSLDKELVTDAMKMRGVSGGLALGSFIQLAGGKGSGKSTIMMKLLTGFSLYEKVCWFDFEMGEDRVVEKLKVFNYDNEKLLYYSASRKLDDVIDEIKFLSTLGVNHFVIDSAMKITVENADRYDKFSKISSNLSELTSSLGINIYMINQISQSADEEQKLSIKHGNDAEYDADFIFFVLRLPQRDANGKVITDDTGTPLIDEENRLIRCEKNRQDERLFKVTIPKYEIITPQPVVVEYEG